MNKTHVTSRAASRTLEHIAAAAARQSDPDADELDDFAESPRMPAAFDDASDWPEQEGDGTAYLGSGYSEQTDDALAPEVETGINLLLHGVSCR
jgi:hypothetical protein